LYTGVSGLQGTDRFDSKDFKRILNPNQSLNISKIRICTLVQGFKSKDFEFQIKDNLDSNKGFLGSRKLEFDSGFESKGRLQYFQRMEI
jgi:hypothetical protein